MSRITTNRSVKLKLILIGCAAYFAMTFSAHTVSVSTDTNGTPGGTLSTPNAESKANPIPPESSSSEIIIEQGNATVMTPEIPPSPPRPVPLTRWY
jgi:hypothetical protein